MLGFFVEVADITRSQTLCFVLVTFSRRFLYSPVRPSFASESLQRGLGQEFLARRVQAVNNLVGLCVLSCAAGKPLQRHPVLDAVSWILVLVSRFRHLHLVFWIQGSGPQDCRISTILDLLIPDPGSLIPIHKWGSGGGGRWMGRPNRVGSRRGVLEHRRIDCYRAVVRSWRIPCCSPIESKRCSHKRVL